MLRSPVTAFVVGTFLIGSLLWGGIAQAADGVFCENPSNPLSCTIVVSAPGSGGTSQGDGSGDGAGGIKPNDGSGSAADYVASRAAGVGSADAAVAGDSKPIASTECDWTALAPSPGAGDPRWGGADPTANTIIQNNCNGPTRYAVVPNGATAGGGAPPPAPPPPPDPAVLAQQAIGQLQIPKPGIHLGPDPDRIAVNFYAWLWLDSAPPVSSTVALRGVSVTATATLSSVDWSMGEPLSLDGGGVGSVTCQGPGVAPSANADFSEPPPCGYMFKYRSLLERTNGVGKWPVAATATWSVSWAASTGQTGADSLSASSTSNVEVGEYRTTRGTGG
jgi:hypothetical protein